MFTKRLHLTPGLTQKALRIFWIGDLSAPTDGFFACTAVPLYGPVEEKTYGVQATDLGWQVWEVTGGVKKDAYLVRRTGAKWVCGCKANRGGSGPECRHLKAVRELVSENLLSGSQLQRV